VKLLLFNNFKEKEMSTLPTRGQSFVYNWQYRKLDGFEKKLGDLLFHADSNNQKKLLKAFPEEVQAVIDYQSVKGWWARCEEACHEGG